jgi:hypothetical protein
MLCRLHLEQLSLDEPEKLAAVDAHLWELAGKSADENTQSCGHRGGIRSSAPLQRLVDWPGGRKDRPAIDSG